MDNNKEIITKISGYVGLDYCTWEGILLKKDIKNLYFL